MSEDVFADLNHTRLRCRIDGPEGAPWLVFSNSLMTDLTLWDDQVAAFGDRYRILRYDQRGHGLSSVPEAACTFPQLVADLAAMLDHFAIERASVVGVSMGGVTALGLAALHPDRVARAAICDCQSGSTQAGAAAWDERIALAGSGGMAALVEPTVTRWFLPASVAAGGPAVDRVRRMIADTPHEGFVRGARALQAYDFRDLPARIACPAAFVVGGGDGALPDVMRKMADAAPGASFTAIAGAGHLPNIEQPERFNDALRGLLAQPERI
jgi:3-oxoadipate enol-lactonase